MGGTDLYTPLKNILKEKQELPLCLFTLTDGQIDDKQEAISIMEKNVHHSRLHMFGIGSGVDHALVKRLAIAGRGSFHIIKDTKS